MENRLNWRGLVADIGGTNARLAVAELEDGVCQLDYPSSFPMSAYADFTALYEAFLHRYPALVSERLPAVIAVAGPVSGNRVALTNISREIDGDRLVAAGLFESCLVVNDFAALAASLPLLRLGRGLVRIGPERQPAGETRLVVGPGTGLGAALQTSRAGRHLVLPGEGGHVAFAPFDELELELLRVFKRRYPERVSYERLLCGQGLVELHEALAMLEGRPVERVPADRITNAAERGEGLERRTLQRFFAILGSFAGDLTLSGGAFAGAYIGGGIVPRIERLFLASPFRQRFEAKGRFREKLAQVPTFLIDAPTPALTGAALLGAQSAS